MWVLGTLAKRWTAARSLRGSIPLSSSRPSDQNETRPARLPFGILTSLSEGSNLKVLGKRASTLAPRVPQEPREMRGF